MPFSSLIGQTLRRVQVLQPMRLVVPVDAGNQAPTGILDCYGAVALFFDSSAVILRSQLRHGRPALWQALANPRSDWAAVTLCSHEEAQWLMQAIDIPWRGVPANQGETTSVHWTGEKLIVELTSSVLLVVSYREDLDAAWLIDADGGDPAITGIDLTTPDSAFGWLLPESPYRISWNGQDWQHLAVLWACLERRQAEEGREALLRHLYALRLSQHPNLLRRFAALRYPVQCQTRPWLAGQIEQMRLKGLSGVTNSDHYWQA